VTFVIQKENYGLAKSGKTLILDKLKGKKLGIFGNHFCSIPFEAAALVLSW